MIILYKNVLFVTHLVIHAQEQIQTNVLRVLEFII